MGDQRAQQEEQAPSALNTSAQGPFLEVAKNKLSVRYTGTATHENDVGAIQANHPVPRRRLIYYWEATVVAGGERGSITIGFTDRSFKHGRQPGWEPGSYGYRGDTGKKYQMCPSRWDGDNYRGGVRAAPSRALHPTAPCSRACWREGRLRARYACRGEEYGPPFGTGDVVGAGIHLPRGQIFFTKNGKHLGMAYRNVTSHPLFPTLGLHSPGATVHVNFGARPFAYDIDGLALAERRHEAEEVESNKVTPGEVHRIVRQYLEHYGYAESLTAFDEAAGTFEVDMGGQLAVAAAGLAAEQQRQPPSSSVAAGDACLALRARLRQLVMAGDVEAAVVLLRQRYPSLLLPWLGATAATNGAAASASSSSSARAGGATFETTFHLACQQFIEYVRRGEIDAALAFGRGSLVGLRGASPAHDAALTSVAALLAYEAPQASTLAHLLASSRREATADAVNAAVLEVQRGGGAGGAGGGGVWAPADSALGTLLRQLGAVQAQLHELNRGQGELFRLADLLPPPPPPPAGHEAAAREQGGEQQEATGAGGAAAMAVG
eukprot:scaffold14.g1255.t1